MKDLHADPQWREYRKNDALFNAFWEKCKTFASKDSKKHWDTVLEEFSHESFAIREEFNKFYSFLKNIPLAAGIGHWIKGVVTDKLWREKYVKGMTTLLEKQLIPLEASLGEFRDIGHEHIIENIRCIQEWTSFEKEELVQCYVQFSHSLAHYTMNFVAPGFDPDRRRTSHRAIKYEAFFDFIQQLSPRDALIAQLLYFGAPSIEEVLSLKKKAILTTRSSIYFKDKEIIFPKHVIQDLLTYLEERTDNKSLVFTNVRGAEVKRAHLNQSFARACEKMSKGIKITPGSLLRLESESES